MRNGDWLTNDPEVAKQLRAIDRAHAKARQKAASWALLEKLSAYRKADEDRRQAYERVWNRLLGKENT